MREFLLALDIFSKYLAERQRNTTWGSLPISEFTRESLESAYVASSPPYVDQMSCTLTIQESVA